MRYTGHDHDVLRYACHRGWLDNDESRCITFGGILVDAAVAQEILRVVRPAGLEAAIMASKNEICKRNDIIEALQRDLEAARYAARRAQKQFDAADQDNRLVVDELERCWNAALERRQ